MGVYPLFLWLFSIALSYKRKNQAGYLHMTWIHWDDPHDPGWSNSETHSPSVIFGKSPVSTWVMTQSNEVSTTTDRQFLNSNFAIQRFKSIHISPIHSIR